MVTNAARRTTAARATLVALLMGLSACGVGNQGASEPTSGQPAIRSATVSSGPEPKHKVEVHLEGIQGAEGRFIAGVLFRAKSITDVRYANAVGGFGVRVDDDPFSKVAAVNDGSSGYIPSLNGPPADVSPGTYTLMMWQGPTLSPYSKWFPADEPGLTSCPVQLVVGDGAVTTVTVTGFPKQPEHAGFDETLRPCLQ